MDCQQQNLNLDPAACDPSGHLALTLFDITLYGRPVISTLGIILNILAICVFSRPPFRTTQSCIILKAEIAADILVLLCGYVYWLQYHVHGAALMSYSPVACKTVVYVTYFSTQLSVALLVLVSAERLLKAKNQEDHYIYFSVSRTKFAIFILILIFLVINLPVLLTHTSDIYFSQENMTTTDRFLHNHSICWNPFHYSTSYLWAANRNKTASYYEIQKWIEFTTYGAFPFIALPILNGILMFEARRRHHTFERDTLSYKLRGDPSIPDSQNPLFNSDELQNRVEHSRIKTKEINRILVLVTISFMVSTSGFHFLQIKDWLSYVTYTPFSVSTDTSAILYTIFSVLFYLNHSSNFFLYCLSCKAYRDELVAMFTHKSNYSRDFKAVSSSSVTHEDGSIFGEAFSLSEET